jgi:hypothetical protein
MNIPSSKTTTVNVPAFCVMRYVAVPTTPPATGPAVAVTGASAASPWVNITYVDAKSACQSMVGVSGAAPHVITERQWMAMAHNMVGMPANWTTGVVDSSGGMYQGVISGSGISSPLAASAGPVSGAYKRAKSLSTGTMVFDIGGNVQQWTTNVAPGNVGGASRGTGDDEFKSAPYRANYMGVGDYAGSGGSVATPVYTAMSGRYDGGSSGVFQSNGMQGASYPWLGFRCSR